MFFVDKELKISKYSLTGKGFDGIQRDTPIMFNQNRIFYKA